MMYRQKTDLSSHLKQRRKPDKLKEITVLKRLDIRQQRNVILETEETMQTNTPSLLSLETLQTTASTAARK